MILLILKHYTIIIREVKHIHRRTSIVKTSCAILGLIIMYFASSMAIVYRKSGRKYKNEANKLAKIEIL